MAIVAVIWNIVFILATRETVANCVPPAGLGTIAWG